MSASNATGESPGAGRLIEVALPVRVERTFTYRIPNGMEIPLGSRVLVPFGKKKEAEGWAVGFPERSPVKKTKALIALLDETPLLSEAMLSFTRWMARYYRAPFGEVLSAAVPAGARMVHAGGRERKAVLAVGRDQAQAHLDEVRKRYPGQARILEVLLGRERGEMLLRDLVVLCETSYSPVNTLARNKILRLEKADRKRDMGVPEAGPGALTLTPAQAACLEGITEAVDRGAFAVFLLQGVTGSGKTEVYLRAIERVLEKGRQAISLVPEISLTPQTVGRYLARFPRVAVLHSSLTNRERGAQWEAIRRGEAGVVVGARSALFAPVPRLGIIVVDEEHEPSFKQDSTPRYHARDAAVMRARQEGALVILGSATPSLESHLNTRRGKSTGYRLPHRVKNLPMPEVEVVDLSVETRETGRLPIFSRRLASLVRETLARNEQAILFLNRRGFATFLQCPFCGFRYECPRCRISLTYHRKINRAICHYCYHGVVPSDTCPECLAPGIKRFGIGTEKVEEAASRLFPEARLGRMDSDAMATRADYEKIYGAVRAKELDILVGTQMLAKGLDFPDVTLVGVVSADAGLNVPDFRAAERTFQLITQVAGRAGRSEKGGRVVVQTFQPDHYSIRAAADQDFDAFAAHETAFRQALGYPPFGRLARLLITGKDEEAVRRRAGTLGGKLQRARAVTVLGPVPAPLAIIRGKHRHQIVIKGPGAEAVQQALDRIQKDLFRTEKGARVDADVDPVSML